MFYGLNAVYEVTMTTIAIGTIIPTLLLLYGVTLHKREGYFIYKVRHFMLACLIIAGMTYFSLSQRVTQHVKINETANIYCLSVLIPCNRRTC